jgi:hypothetical protein
MTKTMVRTRRFLAAVALTVAGTGAVTLAGASPAQADGAWPARYSSCAGNKWLVIDMYVTRDYVRVGWGRTASDAAGGRPNQWTTLYPTGWRSAHTSMHAAYWIKWSSPGIVTQWKTRCVTYT